MNAPTEKLAADVKVLAADIDELVRATAAETSGKLTAARDRVRGALVGARDTVRVQGRDAAATADRYVRENLWTAIAVSGAVGFIIGFLAGRR
jgi:ElaB/YqjD/DUF883 family membrane-anchored ribosome-binding protein